MDWREELKEVVRKSITVGEDVLWGFTTIELESFIEELLEKQKEEIRDRMQKELKEIYKSSAFITDPFYIGKCQGEINSYIQVLEWLGVNPKEGE